MDPAFRIFDFHIYNEVKKEDSNSPANSGSDEDSMEEKRVYQDKTHFFIQMFGIGCNPFTI